MSRSPRALALRITAVVVALLTARTVALDLRSIHDQARALGPLHTVVTARTTLAVGHVVRDGDLATVRRHLSQQPPGTFDSVAPLVGRPIRVDVAAGAPLLLANIGPAHNGASGALAADERAVRIVDTGGLSPDVGAIVDIYATFDAPDPAQSDSAQSDPQSDGKTRLVARGVRVLRVDHDNTELRASRAPADSTGLLVKIKASDTPALASAVANGVITVAIAPVEDACCADN